MSKQCHATVIDLSVTCQKLGKIPTLAGPAAQEYSHFPGRDLAPTPSSLKSLGPWCITKIKRRRFSRKIGGYWRPAEDTLAHLALKGFAAAWPSEVSEVSLLRVDARVPGDLSQAFPVSALWKPWTKQV